MNAASVPIGEPIGEPIGKPIPGGQTVPGPIPPLRVRRLTIEDGLSLASWCGPGAWRIEDSLEPPDPDEGYWAVVDSGDNLLGFCCLGAAARAPGEPDDELAVDVAIGIRPQPAGRGWGGELGRAGAVVATYDVLTSVAKTWP